MERENMSTLEKCRKVDHYEKIVRCNDIGSFFLHLYNMNWTNRQRWKFYADKR